ncbi:MAG TPA: oligosaccharide flippase family protein [Chitinophagaceae bacterium]|nr:oligosaccharide flippase family protein [Chitinophagaceae bacterium]
MQFLLRGFVFRIVFTAIGFLISLLIAKLAGADKFGSLSLIIVNAAFIYIITGLGTDSAIVWHGISGATYSRDKVFSFTIITAFIQLLFFYIIAILGFLFLGHTLLGGSFDLNIFFAEVVYFTGLVFLDKFLSLYYSQHEAKLCNKILAIVSGILFLIVLIIWAIRPDLIANYPVWSYSLFIFIPAMIIFIFFLFKFKPSVKSISQEEYRSFSAFSAIVLITNIIQFIAYRADYWFISSYYGHDTVGVYAQASKFAQLLWIVPGILAGLITPALKNENQKLTDAGLISICKLSFYTHIALGAILLVVSFLIYQFFLPPVYFDGFFSLLIMLPGYLLFTITTILAAYFSANRLLKVNLIGSVICCAVMLLLDFLLIPTMSYKGAAIANLFAYSIATFYVIARLTTFIKTSLKQLFILKKSDFDLFSSRIIKTDNQDT